jgi:hypothetical protein
VFAEDAEVQMAVLNVLWVSIDPKKHKLLSGIRIRVWTSELLSRSILLGSASKGVSMHDIVRDFTLAAHTSEKLQAMQRSFVDELLQRTADPKGDSNGHLSSYASISLVHHVRGAVATPLHDDKLAKGWLRETDNVILDGILLGISQPEIQRLADWYYKNEDWYEAASIFYILAMKSRGRALEAKKASLRCGVVAIVKIPEHKKSANLECLLRKRLWYWTDADSLEEADECLDAVIAILKDEQRCSQLEQSVELSMKNQIAEHLFGLKPTKWRDTVNIEQVKEGARLNIYCGLAFGKMVENMPAGSRKRIELNRIMMNTFAAFSITNVLPKQLSDAALHLLGVAGSKFEIAFDEGGGVFDAGSYARDMSNYGFWMDHIAHYISPSLVRFANMQIYSKAVARFEVWVAHSVQHSGTFELCAWYSWPLLYGRFQHMLICCGLTSVGDVDKVAEGWAPSKIAWAATRDGKNYFYFHRKASVMLMKALMAVNMPDLLQREEADEFVPAVDECPWLKDG